MFYSAQMKTGLDPQALIPKNRTLIQVLPPLKFFCYLLMHICVKNTLAVVTVASRAGGR